jgi:hypothetical protein
LNPAEILALNYVSLLRMLAFWQTLYRDYGDWLVLAILLVIAWLWPTLGERQFRKIEDWTARFAARRGLAILTVILTAILMRVSLLWIYPVRPPGTHDEFSYLLAADTFTHGRLANPPHPMWIFFDTFHVLQHPTYASMYPPGQGAVLALGAFLGHPWIGVLLTMSIMFGVLLWMLQGWFPPQWAFLGAVLPLLRFGTFSYWMNGYWGGELPAIGGALVLGALPRVLRWQRPRDAILLGLGAAILSNTRPLEGLVLFAPVILVLSIWIFNHRSPSWRVTLPKVIIPLGSVLLFTVAFILYYNWRVTQNPFLFPHTLDDRLHLTVSNYVWEQQKPPLQYFNHQFDVFYNHWARNQYARSWESFRHISWGKAVFFQEFYVGAALIFPFVTLPWVLRDRRIRLLLIFFSVCCVGLLAVTWFNPHYAAPCVAALFAIVVQMLRHLRQWKHRGRPVGIGLTRVVVLLTLAAIPYYSYQVVENPRTFIAFGWGQTNWDRARIAEQLDSIPGKHLVLVRYLPTHHNILNEWVYNAADIDSSKIVWAREIPGIDLEPLLKYFEGRKVWVVEPDEPSPHLNSFPDEKLVQPQTPGSQKP